MSQSYTHPAKKNAALQGHDFPIIGYAGDRKNILIIDDEPNHRQIIQEILTPTGFNVAQAKDGENALKLCEKNHFDLFIIDVFMPEMNGFELSKRLRKKNLSTPIAMLSANAMLPERDGSETSIYQAYINKPVSIDELYHVIENLLSIEWIYSISPEEKSDAEKKVTNWKALASSPQLAELLSSAEIGHASGVSLQLKALIRKNLLGEDLAYQISNLLHESQFEKIIALLTEKNNGYK